MEVSQESVQTLFPMKHLREIQKGKVFLRSGVPFMRIKPTGYLLNSTLISDKLNEGFVLITNLAEGTIYFVHGQELVEEVQAKTLWKRSI